MSAPQTKSQRTDLTSKEIASMTPPRSFTLSRRALALSAALLGAAFLLAASAKAQAAVSWSISSTSNTNAAPGENLTYALSLTNDGDENTNGEVKLTAQLPPGFTGLSVRGLLIENSELSCPSVAGETTIECTGPVNAPAHSANHQMSLTVAVAPGASGSHTAAFSVQGGGPGAQPGQTVDPVDVTSDSPPFGFDAFDFSISGPGGEAFTTAAGVPHSQAVNFDFNRHTDSLLVGGDSYPVEDVRELGAELPAGFIGNPTAFPQCDIAELSVGEIQPQSLCPADSQLGTTTVRLGPFNIGPLPVFNMVPPPGVPARFGFNAKGTIIVLDAKLRSEGDFGLTVGSVGIPQAIELSGNDISFWGVPGGASHDAERACPGSVEGSTHCPAESDPVPFLRMPSACTPAGEGLPVTAQMDSWQHPGEVKQASIQTHEAPGYPLSPQPSTFPAAYTGPTQWGAPAGTEGCDQVPFEPAFAVDTTTPFADSPTGLNVDIGLPSGCWAPKATEAEAEAAICQSDMRESKVTLPEGLSINPASAGGRAACTPAQAGLKTPAGQSPASFNEAPVSCPNASKIGEVQITTPVLSEPLKGFLYLAQQGQNPFGSLLAMYLVVEGSGVVIKQAGQISLDPNTGRVITTFSQTPQTPFAKIHFALYGGPRASLRTPSTCGTYTAQGEISPWSGNPAVSLSSSFAVSQGCGGGFDPKLDTGSANPLAGATSPWSLRLSRQDGEQELSSLRLHEPAGLSGYLKGIATCPDAALAAVSSLPGTGAAQEAAPSCPAASQVGTVTVGSGAGVNPFYTAQGKAYLAGPYKGAPLSLAVITPAVAGPLDLGSVAVRNAIYIDPLTAQLTVQSDPLPTILHGIPLDLRDVRVELNRDHFIVNPTSCEAMQFESAIASTQGALASPTVHFQVAGCDRLAFKPKLAFSLAGKPNRGAHPALRAVLQMPRKQGANLARVQVALPHSEFLDQSHIATICTRVQFAAHACPAASVYGHATATSPILDYPLYGPVYLRSSSHELPDLVLSLHGPASQPIEVNAVGRIDSTKGGGIRTSFEALPDVPVSKVVLSMRGGSKGLLQNSTNICTGEHRASASLSGQNGKLSELRPGLVARCAKAKGTARSHHSR